MKIVRAQKKHKDIILETYDLFKDTINKLDGKHEAPSTRARDNSSEMYNHVLNLESGRLFLALDDDTCIGLVSIYLLPQIRKGKFGAEIEEMFVVEDHHGKGVAQELIRTAMDWVRTHDVAEIRLASGLNFHRAHAFYKKIGFEQDGLSFRLKFSYI